MFDTKSSQIPRTFLWLFSQTFGLDYSSEVTLVELHALYTGFLLKPERKESNIWTCEKRLFSNISQKISQFGQMGQINCGVFPVEL